MAILMQDTVFEKSSLSCQLEAVGSGLARYGLAVVIAWKGNTRVLAVVMHPRDARQITIPEPKK